MLRAVKTQVMKKKNIENGKKMVEGAKDESQFVFRQISFNYVINYASS